MFNWNIIVFISPVFYGNNSNNNILTVKDTKLKDNQTLSKLLSKGI